MGKVRGAKGIRLSLGRSISGPVRSGEPSPGRPDAGSSCSGSGSSGHRLTVLVTCLLALLISVPIGLTPGVSGSPAVPIAGLDDAESQPQAADVVPGSYLVVYRENAVSARGVARRGQALGITVDHEFTNVVRGFSASLTPDQVQALRQDDSVLLVEPNVVVEAHDRLPTGVNRIGADSGRNGGRPPTGGKAVAVLDTGVANHPDLNLAGGTSCIGSTDYRDRNGHGTHVAGTIGAKGSVPGVAPNTPIYAVKVLGDNGKGSIADVVCGLEWVAQFQAEFDIVAVNLSLGANCNQNQGESQSQDCTQNALANCSSSAMHTAICNLTDLGIDVVVSAGNDGQDATRSVPARYDQVITVGAFTDTDGCLGGRGRASLSGYRDDHRPPWSNYGPAVDVIAPGDDILSTVPGGYGVLSGTSMAAPHVTGAIARGWNPDGGARGAVVPGFAPGQGVVILSGNVGCPRKPRVKVSRKSVTAGTRVTIRLRHFAPGERVRIRLGGRNLGTVVVNSKGAANKSVKVPARSKVGQVRVRATGNNGNTGTVKMTVNRRR